MPDARRTQSYTKFHAATLGDQTDLQGHFLFGRIEEVQTDWLWRKEKNVGLIVSCTRYANDARYPAWATSDIKKAHWNIRDPNPKRCQEAFDTVWPLVLECLLNGKDVLFHCHESFHRAPIVYACIFQAITGESYKVVLVIIVIGCL